MAEEEIGDIEQSEADQTGEELAEDGEGGAVDKKEKPGMKKLLLFVAAPLLLMLVAGGSAAYFMGWFSGSGDGEVMAEQKDPLFYDLPEMVVNLASSGKRTQYLKLKVALEADDQAALDALEPIMSRILDTFQVYMRELRASDLEGSAGIFRLKEELLRRINISLYPREIKRVLFKEIIIQ
jgi:flagellar FliL protein